MHCAPAERLSLSQPGPWVATNRPGFGKRPAKRASNLRRCGHLCRFGTYREEQLVEPKSSNFGKHYARHLVDVKGLIQYVVILPCFT